MALTPFRWFAGLVIGAMILMLVSLREAPQRRFEIPYLATVERRQGGYSQRARQLAMRLKLTRLLDSTRRVLSKTPVSPVRVLVDGSIPPAIRDSFSDFARRAERHVAPLSGVDVVILQDTATTIHGVELKVQLTGVDYVLPTQPGERCLVFVRLPPRPDPRTQFVRTFRQPEADQDLLGPCALYGAFGFPGPAIESWFRARGALFAHVADWDTVRTRPAVSTRWTNIGRSHGRLLDVLRLSSVQCLAGEAARCEEVMTSGMRERRVSLLNDNVLTGLYPSIGVPSYSSYFYYSSAFGSSQGSMIADMVREFGRDKVGAIWTSKDSLPAAFTSATGKPLGPWLSAWMQARYTTVERGPGMSFKMALESLAWIIAGVGLAILAVQRRRYA